jgi:pyrimidine-nucleoside phosphorylase
LAGFVLAGAKSTRLAMESFDEARMRRAIETKRDGAALHASDWEAMIPAYLSARIGDDQMAAMLMAAVWRGLTLDESAALTKAMVESGETIAFPPGTFVVDKHSSGGVSDIVSLVAVPLVAACGARVAKLSGRALGHTGGTIDKLETISGVRTALSRDEFVAQVERVGCAIAAQSDRIVPADKRLYALRDRTGTVPCVGLIVASIVSKKIAGGAHAFVFDVKCGRGAFLRDSEAACSLARELVAVAGRFGRPARALVTDMDEPLGHAVGTGIEVIEARDFLRGPARDERVRALALRVAGEMLSLAGIASPEAAASRALDSGAAYDKLVEMIEAQGGSREALEAMTHPLNAARATAPRDGYVTEIDATGLGNLARTLSEREPTAGIVTAVRAGDRVERGSLLATAYGSAAAAAPLAAAFTVGDQKPEPRPLVYDAIA